MTFASRSQKFRRIASLAIGNVFGSGTSRLRQTLAIASAVSSIALINTPRRSAQRSIDPSSNRCRGNP